MIAQTSIVDGCPRRLQNATRRDNPPAPLRLRRYPFGPKKTRSRRSRLSKHQPSIARGGHFRSGMDVSPLVRDQMVADWGSFARSSGRQLPSAVPNTPCGETGAEPMFVGRDKTEDERALGQVHRAPRTDTGFYHFRVGDKGRTSSWLPYVVRPCAPKILRQAARYPSRYQPTRPSESSTTTTSYFSSIGNSTCSSSRFQSSPS
jgi:hypothetical protein